MPRSLQRLDGPGTGGAGMAARQGAVHGDCRRGRCSLPVRRDDLPRRAAQAPTLVGERVQLQATSRRCVPQPPLVDDEPEAP